MSKLEASSKNAWTFSQKIAKDLKIVRAFWIYQKIAEIIELIKTDKITKNQGHHLKGLRKAVQSILSDDPREGKYTPPK